MGDLAGLTMTAGGLVLACTFATLHMALLQSARTTLSAIAFERNNKHATRRVEAILADLEGHALVQGLLACIGVLATALGLIALTAGLTVGLTNTAPSAAPNNLDIVVAMAIAIPLLWLVAVALPRSLGEHAGEQIVYRASYLIRLSHWAFAPVLVLAGVLDEACRRLIAPTATEAQAIEADLLSVVEEGRQEGQFDQRESDMIAAVVQLRTTSVQEVMTPRTEIDALAYTDALDEVKAFVRTCQHSRIPVYEENLDHVVGVLYAKDLLHYLADQDNGQEQFELRSLLRPAIFVSDAKSARDVLAEMLERQSHLTLISDEYGGTAGLATVEDIVEEVFGDIMDEYETDEDESPSIDIQFDEAKGDIDARAHIDDLNEALTPLGVELPESDDYDTLGGCMSVRLGHIPHVGETLELGRVRLEVTQAEATRVLRVSLSVLRAPDDDEPAVDLESLGSEALKGQTEGPIEPPIEEAAGTQAQDDGQGQDQRDDQGEPSPSGEGTASHADANAPRKG